jgi:hypothetical protein
MERVGREEASVYGERVGREEASVYLYGQSRV